VQEEAHEEDGADRDEHDGPRGVVGCDLNAHDDEHEPERREDRAGRIGTAVRVSWERVPERACEEKDHGDDERLEDEGSPPADRCGDEASDQRPRRRSDAAHATDCAEGTGARCDVVVQECGEDVDRRDQHRRANPFEDRVPEDQDSQARR
jgi:hypothetical protein